MFQLRQQNRKVAITSAAFLTTVGIAHHRVARGAISVLVVFELKLITLLVRAIAYSPMHSMSESPGGSPWRADQTPSLIMRRWYGMYYNEGIENKFLHKRYFDIICV
jgi:hypothetical protein